LTITSDYVLFCEIPKKEYNNSPTVVFEGMPLFRRNFQGLLINLSPTKPKIFMSKTPLVAEKLLFVRWDIYF